MFRNIRSLLQGVTNSRSCDPTTEATREKRPDVRVTCEVARVNKSHLKLLYHPTCWQLFLLQTQLPDIARCCKPESNLQQNLPSRLEGEVNEKVILMIPQNLLIFHASVADSVSSLCQTFDTVCLGAWEVGWKGPWWGGDCWQVLFTGVAWYYCPLCPLPWYCLVLLGIAMVLPWYCHGIAWYCLVLPWYCLVSLRLQPGIPRCYMGSSTPARCHLDVTKSVNKWHQWQHFQLGARWDPDLQADVVRHLQPPSSTVKDKAPSVIRCHNKGERVTAFCC